MKTVRILGGSRSVGAHQGSDGCEFSHNYINCGGRAIIVRGRNHVVEGNTIVGRYPTGGVLHLYDGLGGIVKNNYLDNNLRDGKDIPDNNAEYYADAFIRIRDSFVTSRDNPLIIVNNVAKVYRALVELTARDADNPLYTIIKNNTVLGTKSANSGVVYGLYHRTEPKVLGLGSVVGDFSYMGSGGNVSFVPISSGIVLPPGFPVEGPVDNTVAVETEFGVSGVSVSTAHTIVRDGEVRTEFALNIGEYTSSEGILVHVDLSSQMLTPGGPGHSFVTGAAVSNSNSWLVTYRTDTGFVRLQSRVPSGSGALVRGYFRHPVQGA